MNEIPDKILVSSIDCVAAVGVSAEERTMKQRLSVDVEVDIDLRKAAASDSLKDTIDYAQIVSLVVDLASERDYYLIEAFAEQIAARVLSDYGGAEVRVRVRKMPPPLSAPVGFVAVEIARRSSGNT